MKPCVMIEKASIMSVQKYIPNQALKLDIRCSTPCPGNQPDFDHELSWDISSVSSDISCASLVLDTNITASTELQRNNSKNSYNKQKRKMFHHLRHERKQCNPLKQSPKEVKNIKEKKNGMDKDLLDYFNNLELPSINRNERDKILAGNVSKIAKDFTSIVEKFKEGSVSPILNENDQVYLTETEALKDKLQKFFIRSKAIKIEACDAEISHQESLSKIWEELLDSKEKNLSVNEVNHDQKVYQSENKIRKRKLESSNKVDEIRSTSLASKQNRISTNTSRVLRSSQRNSKIHSIFTKIHEMRNDKVVAPLEDYCEPASYKFSVKDLLALNEKLRNLNKNLKEKSNNIKDASNGTKDKTANKVAKLTNTTTEKAITKTDSNRNNSPVKNFRALKKSNVKGKQINKSGLNANFKVDKNLLVDLSSVKLDGPMLTSRDDGDLCSKPKVLAKLLTADILKKKDAKFDSGIDSSSHMSPSNTVVKDSGKVIRCTKKFCVPQRQMIKDDFELKSICQLQVTGIKSCDNFVTSSLTKPRNKKKRIFGPLKTRRRKRKSQIEAHPTTEESEASQPEEKFNVPNENCSSAQLFKEDNKGVSNNNKTLDGNMFVNIQHCDKDYNVFWTCDVSKGLKQPTYVNVAECIQNDEEESSSGHVKIDVGISIDCRAMPASSVYYMVTEGEAEVGFMKKTWTLKVGSSFHVPKGNDYYIKNLSTESSVKLFYVKYFSKKEIHVSPKSDYIFKLM